MVLQKPLLTDYATQTALAWKLPYAQWLTMLPEAKVTGMTEDLPIL